MFILRGEIEARCLANSRSEDATARRKYGCDGKVNAYKMPVAWAPHFKPRSAFWGVYV